MVINVRRRRSRVDTGIGTVRRLYFYSVSFVALMMVANGVMLVSMDLLDRLFGGSAVSDSTTRLAWGLALIIVGLPLWAFHWRAMAGHVAINAVETQSEIRKIYLYLIIGVALIFMVIGAFTALEQVFNTEDFKGFSWAAVVVWSVVWGLHWRIDTGEGHPTPETLGIRRFYLYVASLATLVLLALGAGRVVHVILSEGYSSAFSSSVVLSERSGIWTHALRSALAAAIVGGGVWAVHWFVFARRDFESSLRWAYLYVFAILGGIFTTMISTGLVVAGVLMWAFRAPVADPTVEHFEYLPAAIASLGVGISIWSYHWWRAQHEAGQSPLLKLSANRAYEYIVAALGLSALSFASFAAIDTGLAVLIEQSRELISGDDLWREQFAVTLTLALIGGSFWGYYWRSAQRRLALDDTSSERSSLSRKVFTFLVLGIGVLALLISASATLFVFLRDALDASLALDTLRDIRPAIAVALTAGFILPYQWSVYRADRLSRSEVRQETVQPKRVSVLAQAGSQEFIRGIEDALGYSVETLYWTDAEAVTPLLTSEALSELASRVADSQGPSVLIVPEPAGARVLSYD
ncbi:MAG: DUF5671 domain-containing protein [SAR202 cluster bacterium]|nr:DUF5671 domain-containing protein [SAR202 cluster bacterium]